MESWEFSLAETVAAEVPHASVYMLEVDEDSRLGRELIAGGTRYHAHFVPDEDLTADLYLAACEHFAAAGLGQYEISNFARSGFESSHNLKYWTRQPYLGFGVDAHSMLKAAQAGDIEAVRFSAPDSLEQFLAGAELVRTPVSRKGALEEAFFLGLRLSRGVDLRCVELEFGTAEDYRETIGEFIAGGLLEHDGDVIRLTSRGRLLSNEVFERFVSEESTSRR
jgi:oxygen-independent coproporphyrinogen-3 oxidase